MNRNDDLVSRLLVYDATEQGSTQAFFVTLGKILKSVLYHSSSSVKEG